MTTRIYKIVALAIIMLTLLLSQKTQVVEAINNGGSGYCWASGAAWPSNSTTYKIDSTIPSSWNTNITNSAATWNNVGSSSFTLNNNSSSVNIISKGTLVDTTQIALASVFASPTTINKVLTVFDQTDSFTAALPPPPSTYWVTEIMTHEFGHWLYLQDIKNTSCSAVTMYWQSGYGDTLKSSLVSYDINGIAWQYP